MIRLIASDIDGTLIRDSSHHINPEYYDVVMKLKEKGVTFCLCSGRQFHSMHELFAPIAKDIYFICENGSVLRTEEKILLRWRIVEDQVRGLLADLKGIPGASRVLNTPDYAYVDCGEDGLLYRVLTENYHYKVINVPALEDLPMDNVCKLSIYHPEGAEKACAGIMNSHWKDELQITASGIEWIEICAKESGKGEAFALLQEYLEIPMAETLYFGDNMNDLSAFSEAGIAMTVANARSEVQDKAHLVAAPYSSDGVLQQLKFILMTQ